MSDNAYTTGEGYFGYAAQIANDIKAVPGYSAAGEIVSPSSGDTGKSLAGNNAFAQVQFQAVAQTAGAAMYTAQGMKGVPETPSSTWPQGDASRNNAGIFGWTPNRYTT